MKMRPKENITIWEEDESLPQHMSPTPPAHYSQPKHVPPTSSSPLTTTAIQQQKNQKTPGTLSLHEYRKHLSHPEPDSPAPSSDISNSEGQKRRLRRKKRAANLYLQHSNSSSQEMMASRWYADPSLSVSSASSSSTPPSLSSSYSVSALSQTQTQGSELDVDVPGSVQDGRMNSMNLKAGNGKNEDVSSGSPKDLPYKTHTKACSDTILSRRGTTISHGGTSFQILNPRDSLRDARIVSFIEDVEYPSPRRHGFGETEGIIEEDAGPDTHGDDQKAHLIMGDMPRAPIPSISSRLESERGSESAISPIIPSPNHPALNTRNESIRHYSHEQVSPLSSTAGISPHSDDTDLAYFHPLPNPTSYYPFTSSPSAGEMGMGNIHSFYIHDSSPPPAEKKTGPRKLRKSRSAAVCTQEKKKIDVFRPFRRLREVVRGF